MFNPCILVCTWVSCKTILFGLMLRQELGFASLEPAAYSMPKAESVGGWRWCAQGHPAAVHVIAAALLRAPAEADDVVSYLR